MLTQSIFCFQDLSGGERNRLQLACTLKENGNLLLLDEPTNDLDVDTLRALEDAVTNFAGCAVIISHDRYFLDRVATHILAFEVRCLPGFCFCVPLTIDRSVCVLLRVWVWVSDDLPSQCVCVPLLQPFSFEDRHTKCLVHMCALVFGA